MGNVRVLYAEDDLSNRKIMEYKLSKINIDCKTVQNGAEAIEMFKQKKFNLVILDRLMPNKNDGIETLHKIKEIDENIPSMCLTSDDWDIKDLEEAGFNSIFIKPIIGDKFTNEIKKLCKIF